MKTVRRKSLALGGLFALSALALVGWMHTPSARPLLAALGVHCPADAVTLSQVDSMRGAGLAGLRGAASAPARPAPAGLALDRTSIEDARRWAVAHNAACDSIERGYQFLRCRGVDAKDLGLAGPAISELWLSFGSNGRLVGVDVYRRGMSAEQLAASWSGAVDLLRARLGTPTLDIGKATPQALSSAPLQTARVQYRYADYIATVTASHLPHAGLALREQYLSARM